MPDFSPAQALPDDEEQQIVTTPIAKTAGGQAYVGAPSAIDPSQAIAEKAAADARRFVDQQNLAAFNAANPGLAGAPAAPATPAAPPPPAVVAHSGQPGATTVTVTTAPPAAPGAPAAPALAPAPSGAPAPAHGAPRPPATPAAPLQAQQAAERKTAEGLQAEQVQAQQDVNAQRGARADVESGNADQAAADQAAHAVAVGDAIEKGQAFIAQRERERDAAVAKARKAKIQDYYSNQTDGSQILNLLGIVVGGAAGGLTGKGGNAALDQYNRQVDADFNRQRANIEHLQDSAAMARAGVLDAQKARDVLLADVDAQYVASLRASEAFAIQKLKALGKSEADINGNAAIIDLRQKQADANRAGRQQDQEEYLKQITTESNLKTAAAQRAAAYASAEESRAKATAAKATAGTKDDALAVRDTDGNTLGIAGNRVMANKLNSDIANLASYREVLDQLAAHIKKYGRIVDLADHPQTENGKERMRLAGEAVAKGRQVMGLQASDKGQELEHQIVGGSGVGIASVASPTSLGNLAREAQTVVQNRINTGLRRTPEQAAAQAGAAGPPPATVNAADQAALSWYRNLANRKADPAAFDSLGARLKQRGLL